MLKRISVQELKLGMHLKEFCGSWMDHPFWRTGFVLKNPKDLSLILASKITEVWIDCDKGDDLPPERKPNVIAHATQSEPPPRQISPIPAAEEIRRASRICQQGKAAVVSMFEEVRMGRAVDTGGARQLVEEISDSVSRNPGAIISLARLKTADDYTYMHSVAVCAMMVALGKQMGLQDVMVRSCGMAGLLHDLGKAAMPMEILNKPGKLTDEEFVVIKSHPTEGHKMLIETPGIDPVALDVVLHHHEKMDGSGYPKGLKGDEITQFAKMGAVCDVYDAITSNRPYKTGWDPAESLRKMAQWADGHFDPMIFQAFVKSMGIYPVGSLVRLTSGRIGVVTEQTAKSLTTPMVKVFFSTKSNMRIAPVMVNLATVSNNERIQNREDPTKWNFSDLNELWSGIA